MVECRDGDPLLTGRLSLPSPADERAAELRQINRILLVADRRRTPSEHGEPIAAPDLNALVTRPGDNLQANGMKPAWADDRVFFLRWQDRGDEWLLIEDEETPARSRNDAAVAASTTK
jgi:hypothetical protein